MSRYIVGEPLFWSKTLSDHLAKTGKAAAVAVQRLSCEDILGNTPEKTLESVLNAHGKERTSLKKDTIRLRQTETQVDVQNDFRRDGPYGRPVYVQAMKIELVTTFNGSNVFALRPSKFTFNPPRGYVEDNTIVVGRCIPLDVLSRYRDEAIQEMRSTIDQIKTVLQQIKADTDDWESQLHDLLRQEIETRRTNCLAMQETSQLTSRLLGVPTEDNSATSAIKHAKRL